MLISLAENAFKHGVEPKIGPARIEVSARRTVDGSLEITVADDGVGFGAGKPSAAAWGWPTSASGCSSSTPAARRWC